MTFDATSAPAIADSEPETHRRFTRVPDWLTTEVATLRALYPMGGAVTTQAALPHRSLAAVRAKASAEGIRCKRSSTAGLFMPRLYQQRDDIDNMIREGYIHAGAKGAIKALADRIGRPAWWVQKRAATLGVTRTNRTRIDAWLPAELAIVERWAVCDIKVIAQKLRAAGFQRTPTGVAVKLKRMKFDREDPDRWSATAVAPMLGVNPATVADWVERRGLPAVRETWGSNGRLMIERKSLRNWVSRNRRYIDLRRVDQTWFMDLIFGSVA